MSFKVIAQMMDTASNFETRLVLLGNSLTQDKEPNNSSKTQGAPTPIDMEVVNVGALRNSLKEAWGYFFLRSRTSRPSET